MVQVGRNRNIEHKFLNSLAILRFNLTDTGSRHADLPNISRNALQHCRVRQVQQFQSTASVVKGAHVRRTD